MTLEGLVSLLNCKRHNSCGFDPDREISFAFSCDLMSDALMLVRNVEEEDAKKAILVTGLATNQSIRTAQMLDISTVLLVRDKKPSDALIEVACESNITLLSCEYGMYTTSGLMFKEGIKGYENI